MTWNWQQPDWPHFSYDQGRLAPLDAVLQHESGLLFGAFKHLDGEDKTRLSIDLISNEALKTSEIEGEYLDRASVQSSLRRHFGLDAGGSVAKPAEQGIADMMADLYHAFQKPLSEATLFSWHTMLMAGRHNLHDVGRYRTHPQPMQVVSGRIDAPKVHFEAPPSDHVPREMQRFLDWFNATAPGGASQLPVLVRAGIAHLYFVCIHPFEDGNGRLGRAIAEKALAQGLGQPTLTALSHTIEKNRKAYYAALEGANRDNEITAWLLYFSETVLEAQRYTQQRIELLIEKTKLLGRLAGQLNARQEKALLRMFQKGPEGFQGGMSAEKYISLTRTSRATATRDLHDLVSLGALTRTGERKHTRYHLKLAMPDIDTNGS